jgi:hypothetical protein
MVDGQRPEYAGQGKATFLRHESPCERKVPSVVKKSDNSSAEASVAVEVTVLDANDNNPVFTPSNLYEFTVENDARFGDVIGQVGFDFTECVKSKCGIFHCFWTYFQ